MATAWTRWIKTYKLIESLTIVIALDCRWFNPYKNKAIFERAPSNTD
jgi:hypothetical protein